MAKELDEQIGVVVVRSAREVLDFVKAFGYGAMEILSLKNKKGEKSYGSLIGFFIMLIISAAIFVFADKLISYLPEASSRIGMFLRKPIIFKILSPVILVLYIKLKGDERLQFLNSFDEKFEAVGLHSKLVKEKIDVNGNKIRVKDYPKLIKEIKRNDTRIFLFTSRGIPVAEWRKKIPELESTMDLGILSIDYKKDSRKVVRMVTVPYEKKAERRKYDDAFEKLGIYTRLDGVKYFPELIETTEDGKKVIYKFNSEGLPLTLWKDKRESIESTLNTNVVQIKNEKDSKKIIELVTVPLKHNIQESYPWSDDYISDKDFEIILGEGLLERQVLNFNTTPHVLIGGLTGAGKSVLERAITWQVIKKGAKAFFVDFKGGIELDSFKDFGEVVSDRKRFLVILLKLVKEHHERIKEFKTLDVKNIVEYNKKSKTPLARVFVIVDEVAELFDTSGISDKNELEIYKAIEGKMSTLARLSRATGINMILATQRPDATVIKGQIKNNLGARISGRMTDKEPSIMILGSPEATKLPEDIKGRFLYSLGAEPIEFQGYYFKDTDIKPGSYQKGIMLTGSDRLEIKSNVEVVDDFEEYKDDEPYEEPDEEIDDLEDENDDIEESSGVEELTGYEDDGYWTVEEDELV